MTPKYWFRRNTDDGTRPAYYHLHPPKQIAKPIVGRRNKKRLILSQTMVIDVDPLKVVVSIYLSILMQLSNSLV